MASKKLKAPVNIPTEKIHSFEGHPYKVLDNEELALLTEKILISVGNLLLFTPENNSFYRKLFFLSFSSIYASNKNLNFFDLKC